MRSRLSLPRKRSPTKEGFSHSVSRDASATSIASTAPWVFTSAMLRLLCVSSSYTRHAACGTATEAIMNERSFSCQTETRRMRNEASDELHLPVGERYFPALRVDYDRQCNALRVGIGVVEVPGVAGDRVVNQRHGRMHVARCVCRAAGGVGDVIELFRIEDRRRLHFDDAIRRLVRSEVGWCRFTVYDHHAFELLR